MPIRIHGWYVSRLNYQMNKTHKRCIFKPMKETGDGTPILLLLSHCARTSKSPYRYNGSLGRYERKKTTLYGVRTISVRERVTCVSSASLRVKRNVVWFHVRCRYGFIVFNGTPRCAMTRRHHNDNAAVRILLLTFSTHETWYCIIVLTYHRKRYTLRPTIINVS